MNKNSVIGFILIGVILFGFSWYQSRQYRKQAEYQAQLDSLALVQMQEQMRADSIYRAEHPELYAADSLGTSASAVAPGHTARPIYKDSSLNVASNADASMHVLSNDKVEVTFTTKGAQPYSVMIKDYMTYDSTALYLIKPDMSEYGVTVYARESINTKNFVFDVTESTDSTLVMRLPFANGGYIEQKYTLQPGSYMVRNELSFVGMEEVIPRNVTMFDIDWSVVIPRLEKGYNNELQYSKLNYRFPDDKKVHDIGRGRDADKRLDARVSWFAFQQQFFSAIMRAENDFASTDLKVKFFEEDDPQRDLMACSASMRCDLDVNSSKVTVPFEFYFGPNDFKTLKSYDQKYEKIIPLGGWLVGWISRIAIIPCFDFFGKFISSYGIIILLMTILIKLVVSPLTIKSYISSAKMNVIRPEVDKLNEKYPKQEDAMKKQQAMMNLYKRAGINPMGGCLPMLLQFPILFAMFRFFPASIELRQQSFLWADDLSAYDSILDLPFRIPLYGDHVSLFALLMAISMFVYSKMTSSQMSNDPNMAGMKFMSVWLMPIMMLFICNNLSSGLSYYYLLSNLITMLQTWFVRRFVVDEKKIHAQLAATEGKPLPKSKWQQRLEEAQKMQEKALKEQQKRRR
ncbi:MAG: membrane protein insertase YidC [Bacteroidetes bacterium]|uniref:Membrane protein insertase YidC n=1 Tax=Candidatus Cryptobacteroides faecigallinarum TaxID=2840763 RepID=A0A9D9NIP0_9BACT|nr:membrane protein insertase YidC [Candidatus Cryptobacteroides faecigallinarum]